MIISTHPFVTRNGGSVHIRNRVFGIITLVVLIAVSITPVWAFSFDEALAIFQKDPVLKKSDISICIRDCSNGKVILDHNSTGPLIPASNLKILTGGVALMELGTDYRFKTLIGSSVKVQPDGRLLGDLYIKGFGNPVLVSEELWLLSKDIFLSGLREIRGDIIADDTFFDAERKGRGWRRPDRPDWYTASIGALSLNFNTLTLLFSPDSTTSLIKVYVDPPTEYAVIRNQAKIGKGYYHVKRKEVDGRNEITFSGYVSQPGREIVNIVNPPMYTAKVFSEMLRSWGIRFHGKIVQGVMPEGTNIIFQHRSKILKDIVTDLNFYSNNFVAEQILKTMGAELIGAPGTAEKGIQVIKDHVRKTGYSVDGLELADGSGLSRDNRVSASLLTFMLYRLHDDYRFRYDYVQSLPTGGLNGTLKHRMKKLEQEKRIRAKTGRISRVNSISGYLFPDGAEAPLAFSILINNFKASHDYIMQVQDRFLETVLESK